MTNLPLAFFWSRNANRKEDQQKIPTTELSQTMVSISAGKRSHYARARWQQVIPHILWRKSTTLIFIAFLSLQSIRLTSKVTDAFLEAKQEVQVGSSMAWITKAQFKLDDRKRMLLSHNSSSTQTSLSGAQKKPHGGVHATSLRGGKAGSAPKTGDAPTPAATVNNTKTKTEKSEKTESTLQYCPWVTSGPRSSRCKELLEPHLTGKKHWFFLGDSNMYLTYKQIRIENEKMGWELTKEHTTGRCNYTDYYGLEKAHEWVFPNHSRLEGPVGIGYTAPKPWCSDLHWAFNQKIEKDGTSLEFLVCDFARDVETPSQTTATTQESIALYLSKAYPEKAENVCIANAGLHDMAIPGPYADKPYLLYVGNVQEYLGLLKEQCHVVVWVTIVSTKGDNRYPQMNPVVRRWNRAVLAMIQDVHPDVFVFDQFVESHEQEHVDNAHLTTEYYNQMGRFWKQFSDPTVADQAIDERQ